MADSLLILGASWTAGFLLQQRKLIVTFAATTRKGRKVTGYKTKTIAFEANSDMRCGIVPQAHIEARTIILAFPTIKEGAVTTYVEAYELMHGHGDPWLQLGSNSALLVHKICGEHAAQGRGQTLMLFALSTSIANVKRTIFRVFSPSVIANCYFAEWLSNLLKSLSFTRRDIRI